MGDAIQHGDVRCWHKRLVFVLFVFLYLCICVYESKEGDAGQRAIVPPPGGTNDHNRVRYVLPFQYKYNTFRFQIQIQ